MHEHVPSRMEIYINISGPSDLTEELFHFEMEGGNVQIPHRDHSSLTCDGFPEERSDAV